MITGLKGKIIQPRVLKAQTQKKDPAEKCEKPILALVGKPLTLDRPSVDAHAEGELIDEKQICVKAGAQISTVNHLATVDEHTVRRCHSRAIEQVEVSMDAITIC